MEIFHSAAFNQENMLTKGLRQRFLQIWNFDSLSNQIFQPNQERIPNRKGENESTQLQWLYRMQLATSIPPVVEWTSFHFEYLRTEKRDKFSGTCESDLQYIHIIHKSLSLHMHLRIYAYSYCLIFQWTTCFSSVCRSSCTKANNTWISPTPATVSTVCRSSARDSTDLQPDPSHLVRRYRLPLRRATPRLGCFEVLPLSHKLVML